MESYDDLYDNSEEIILSRGRIIVDKKEHLEEIIEPPEINTVSLFYSLQKQINRLGLDMLNTSESEFNQIIKFSKFVKRYYD